MDESLVSPSIAPVILCGGGGTRLWPRSRKSHPKPFLPLLGERTMFQMALDRCANGEIFSDPLIVAGRDHASLVQSQSGPLASGALIVEPCARNTAPAVALAAARLNPDAIMMVCPSDHFVADTKAFETAAINAAALASDGWLVSLAITPNRPEVGYGYIKQGDPLKVGYKINRFVEKPDAAKAIAFLAEGGYSWNAGIFAFRAGTLLAELAEYRPDMASLVSQSVAEGELDGIAFHPAAAPFEQITGESVDFALMENTKRAAMVPASMGWSDIGNWASLHDISAKDETGNAQSGPAELIQCENVLITSDGPRVSAVGLKDICVIVDGHEVLVTTRDAAPHVGKLSGPRDQ